MGVVATQRSKLSMTDFKAQLPSDTPLETQQRFEFSGWHRLIAEEVAQLLRDKTSDWLCAVALQIDGLLSQPMRESLRRIVECSRSLTNSQGDTEIHPDEIPGQIHKFAALEPHSVWPQAGHPFASARWERYAVFALWKIHDATRHLPSPTPQGEAPAELLTTLYGVDVSASLTIEAMRALQIAQVLKYQAEELSRANRERAAKRHEPNRDARERALYYARLGKNQSTGEPFKSRAAAAQAIAPLLIKLDGHSGTEGRYTDRVVERWLAEAGWTPSEETKAEWRAFDEARKRARRAGLPRRP